MNVILIQRGKLEKIGKSRRSLSLDTFLDFFFKTIQGRNIVVRLPGDCGYETRVSNEPLNQAFEFELPSASRMQIDV